MPAKALNLNESKDLEEFFRALIGFEFRALHDETYRLVLIEGRVEYFGYYGNDKLKVEIQNGDKVMRIVRDDNHYIISMTAPGKYKEFVLPKYIVIEYRDSRLAIEY